MQGIESINNGTAMNLSRGIFWDTNYDTIDWDKKARYVIGRVVTRGNWSDWLAIVKSDGIARIQAEMLQERYLDKKALNFLSNLFNIPKTQFRCYTLQQSNPGHWDF